MSTLTITVTNANAKKGTRETTVIVRLTSVKTLTARIMACAQLVMATLSAHVCPAGPASTVNEEGTFAKRTLVSTTVNVSKCPTMKSTVSHALVCQELRGVYVN